MSGDDLQPLDDALRRINPSTPAIMDLSMLPQGITAEEALYNYSQTGVMMIDSRARNAGRTANYNKAVKLATKFYNQVELVKEKEDPLENDLGFLNNLK